MKFSTVATMAYLLTATAAGPLPAYSQPPTYETPSQYGAASFTTETVTSSIPIFLSIASGIASLNSSSTKGSPVTASVSSSVSSSLPYYPYGPQTLQSFSESSPSSTFSNTGLPRTGSGTTLVASSFPSIEVPTSSNVTASAQSTGTSTILTNSTIQATPTSSNTPSTSYLPITPYETPTPYSATGLPRSGSETTTSSSTSLSGSFPPQENSTAISKSPTTASVNSSISSGYPTSPSANTTTTLVVVSSVESLITLTPPASYTGTGLPRIGSGTTSNISGLPSASIPTHGNLTTSQSVVGPITASVNSSVSYLTSPPTKSTTSFVFVSPLTAPTPYFPIGPSSGFPVHTNSSGTAPVTVVISSTLFLTATTSITLASPISAPTNVTSSLGTGTGVPFTGTGLPRSGTFTNSVPLYTSGGPSSSLSFYNSSSVVSAGPTAQINSTIPYSTDTCLETVSSSIIGSPTNGTSLGTTVPITASANTTWSTAFGTGTGLPYSGTGLPRVGSGTTTGTINSTLTVFVGTTYSLTATAPFHGTGVANSSTLGSPVTASVSPSSGIPATSVASPVSASASPIGSTGNSTTYFAPSTGFVTETISLTSVSVETVTDFVILSPTATPYPYPSGPVYGGPPPTYNGGGYDVPNEQEGGGWPGWFHW